MSVVVVVLSACVFAQLPKTELKPETTAAFESCLTEMEASILQKRSSIQTFVRNYDPALANDHGVVINEGSPCSKPVPHGLVHHWIADAFIPGVTVQDVFRVLKDVGKFPTVYSPQVVSAYLISDGGTTRQVKVRFTSTHVLITVVLDVVFEVHDGQLDESHIYSTSRSVRLQQIKNAGERSEHALKEGNDEGTLWRQNTYWQLEQRPNGVVAECETISLTRDVPALASAIVSPFVTAIPKESLDFTLTKTKNAVKR